MLALIDFALDVINDVAEPIANKKRLKKAQETFGDNTLVPCQLGHQVLLLPESTVKVLEDTGMWGQLAVAAERGNQLSSIYRRS